MDIPIKENPKDNKKPNDPAKNPNGEDPPIEDGETPPKADGTDPKKDKPEPVEFLLPRVVEIRAE